MSEKIPKVVDDDEKEEEKKKFLAPQRKISPMEFTEKMLEADFEEVYRNYPLTEDTTCGLGFLRGRLLQK